MRLSAEADPSATGTLHATAEVAGAEADPNPANDTEDEATDLVPEADLGVVLTDSIDPATPGMGFTYSVQITNDGPSDATGVTASLPLPAGVTFSSATGGGTHAAGTVTWNIASLNAGASGSVQMVARVNSPLANGTTITNASYAIDSAETSPVGGGAVTTTVTAAPVLTISKTDPPDPSFYIIEPTPKFASSRNILTQ